MKNSTENAPKGLATATYSSPIYSALFVRKDSAYKKRDRWDCYDADRDALSHENDNPVVTHSPCRLWGILAHMASNAREGEKELTYFALEKVRKNGGLLEHPSSSRIFKELPDVDGFPDDWGGFTIEIDQFDFGPVAHKMTKLYIVGLSILELPAMPKKRTESADRSICGNVAGTKRCTQYQREYTPENLIDWIERTMDVIITNKRLSLR